MAIQLLDQVWPAEDRARLRVVKQQVGSWVGSWASGAWWAGEGMASRPRAFCCRVLGSKPPRLGAVPQPGGGLGESSAAPQRRTPPAPSRWAGSVDAGPGTRALLLPWDRSSRSRRQVGQVWSEPRRVHAGRELLPAPGWGSEFTPSPPWERERPHRVHAGRESPLRLCRERERSRRVHGDRESPRCVYAGRACCLHPPCGGPHVTPLTPWTGGKGRDRRARPVLNRWTDRFPARESEPLIPGWGWGRRVELPRLYSLP